MPGKRLLSVAASAVLAATAACDAPGPVSPPPLSDQLFLFAFLNADSARQSIEVSAVDHFNRPSLSGVTVKIFRQQLDSGSRWALVSEWDSARAAAAGGSLTDLEQCWPRSGEWPQVFAPPMAHSVAGGLYCMTPELRLEPGATYRVEAVADGRSPARGETTIPGDFAIERAVLSRDAGSHVLSAGWTRSVAAHRYMVAIRKRYDFCVNCFSGWSTDLDSTSFAGAVPRMAVDSAGAVPMLDIAAVDRHLHAYLTTGHAGGLHAVHPIQNVRGGLGVVGALCFRNRAIDRRSPEPLSAVKR